MVVKGSSSASFIIKRLLGECWSGRGGIRYLFCINEVSPNKNSEPIFKNSSIMISNSLM